MVLAALALLGSLGAGTFAACTPDDELLGPGRAATALTATQIAGIKLTYMCGNKFRVRNPNEEAVPVTWDVYGTTDHGALTLPPKPAGQPYSETFFTTVRKGTVRLFYNGQLIQTKANGGSVCLATVPAQAPDTLPSWVYADSNISPGSAYVSGSFVKRIVTVRFRRSATQAERQAAIDLVAGTVIGGRNSTGNGLYYVSVADPGDGSALVQAETTLDSLPQVLGATLEQFVGPNYLKSVDGPGWTEWSVRPTTADGQNWALEAIGAPLAWGCTTGGPGARVAVVDVGFQNLPEVTRNAVLAQGVYSPAQVQDHGTAVASLLAAYGNDSTLMTGLMWRAAAKLYDYGSGSQGNVASPDPLGAAAETIGKAGMEGAQVISVSAGIVYGVAPRVGNPEDIRRVERSARQLSIVLSDLQSAGRRPLVILSAGNDSLDAWWNGFPAAKAAGNAGQIIVVGGTTRQGGLWEKSNRGGLVDVVAPAEGVYVLSGANIVDSASGTSLSAPLVAGIAGLVLTIDSSLDATALKNAILQGAIRANTPVGSYFLANAYESLKLAAAARGLPLCGTHVWSSNGSVVARRGGTLDTLFSIGEPASYVNARHGGRRVDVYGDQSSFSTFLYQDGSWIKDLSDTLPDTLSGGTWNASLFASHDGDSLVFVSGGSDGSTTTFGVRLEDLRAHTSTELPDPIAVPVEDNTASECWRREVPSPDSCSDSVDVGTRTRVWARQSFSPLGDRVLVAINHVANTVTLGGWVPCPDQIHPQRECRPIFTTEASGGAEFYQYSLPSGSLTSLPGWTVGGADNVYWLGLSEDGTEVVLGVGGYTTASHVEYDANGLPSGVDDGTTYSGCRVSYRRAATFALVSDEATQDVCEQDEAVGTISPRIATAAPGPGVTVPVASSRTTGATGLLGRLTHVIR